jgi:hypothetical protein
MKDGGEENGRGGGASMSSGSVVVWLQNGGMRGKRVGQGRSELQNKRGKTQKRRSKAEVVKNKSKRSDWLLA